MRSDRVVLGRMLHPHHKEVKFRSIFYYHQLRLSPVWSRLEITQSIRTVKIKLAWRSQANRANEAEIPLIRKATAVRKTTSPCDGAVACGTQQTYKLTMSAVATCYELVGLTFSTRDTIVRRIGGSASKSSGNKLRERH